MNLFDPFITEAEFRTLTGDSTSSVSKVTGLMNFFYYQLKSLTGFFELEKVNSTNSSLNTNTVLTEKLELFSLNSLEANWDYHSTSLITKGYTKYWISEIKEANIIKYNQLIPIIDLLDFKFLPFSNLVRCTYLRDDLIKISYKSYIGLEYKNILLEALGCIYYDIGYNIPITNLSGDLLEFSADDRKHKYAGGTAINRENYIYKNSSLLAILKPLIPSKYE